MSTSKQRPYGAPNPVGRPRKHNSQKRKQTRQEQEREAQLFGRAREHARQIATLEVECFKCGNFGFWEMNKNIVAHRDGSLCYMHNWDLGVNHE